MSESTLSSLGCGMQKRRSLAALVGVVSSAGLPRPSSTALLCWFGVGQWAERSCSASVLDASVSGLVVRARLNRSSALGAGPS